MTKNEFIRKLNSRLSNFPETEVSDRVSFYTEIIDDYIDEGISEEEAVEKLGSIDEIVSSIASEIPLTKIAKKKFKSRRRLNTLEKVLLIVGSPIWVSLFAAFLAVIISLYAALWSIVISLWAIVVSCFACSFASLILFIINLCVGNSSLGFGFLGTSLVLLGVSLLFMLLSKYLTVIVVKVPKIFFKLIKSLLIIKEKENEESK